MKKDTKSARFASWYSYSSNVINTVQYYSGGLNRSNCCKKGICTGEFWKLLRICKQAISCDLLCERILWSEEITNDVHSQSAFYKLKNQVYKQCILNMLPYSFTYFFLTNPVVRFVTDPLIQ